MPPNEIKVTSSAEVATTHEASPTPAPKTDLENGSLGGVSVQIKTEPSAGAETLKKASIQKPSASHIPSPTRDVEHLQKLSHKLFGAGNHFKTTTPWIQLQAQILRSPALRGIDVHHLESIFDKLQADGIKGHGFLASKDLLSILKKIDAITIAGLIDAAPIDAKDERGRLSRELSEMTKNIINKPGASSNNEVLDGLNEYRPKEEIEILLEAYMADLPQAQVETIMNKFSTYRDDAPAVDRLKSLLSTLREASHAVKAYNLDSLVKSKFEVIKGPKIGEGGRGNLYQVQLDGNTKLLKELKNGSLPIKLDMKDPSNPKLLRSEEVTASFLHDDERKTVLVPTHYLVTEKSKGSTPVNYLVEAKDKGFRDWAKDRLLSNSGTAEYSLEISGTFQDYAKGVELLKYLSNSSESELRGNLKAIFSSYIDALEVLSRRGFVHGDLKLENAFFDPVSGKISLIDTGGMVKISKKPERQNSTEFNLDRGATVVYSTPNTLADKKVGFEQDIFAVGMQALEILEVANFIDGSDYYNIIGSINNEQDRVHGGHIKPRIASQKIQGILQSSLLHLKDKSHPLYKFEKFAYETISLGASSNPLVNVELNDGSIVSQNKKALSSLKKLLT